MTKLNPSGQAALSTHTSATLMSDQRRARTGPGALIKKSMRIAEHRTSIALEAEFWDALKEIAQQRGLTLPKLFAEIDEQNQAATPERSLASAARVHALNHWRQPTGRT
jgi:predicted DNA-binding ribbon-helix-helix protein